MPSIQYSTCPVCANQKNTCLRDYRSSGNFFNDLSLMSCGECSLVFAYPPPSQSVLDTYNKNYFQNAHLGLPKSEEAILFQKALAQLRKEYIASYISRGGHTVNNILELGPGLGYLAQSWLQEYPHHQYYVFETDEDCRNLLEPQGVLCDKRPEKGSVDLVIASHVLEHVTDPINFLGDIVDYIRPGGCIFIEVPCQDYLHKSLDEPHLLFFTDRSIKTLLTRLNFIDINTSYHGRSIASLIKPFSLSFLFNKFRSRLAKKGRLGSVIANINCKYLSDPLQKAVMLPYQPHISSKKPAWWLRTMARLPG